MNETGHIRLSRKFVAHPFWMEDRTFSRAEAWLDMIADAAFANRKKLVSGTMVQIPRGGIVASERFLSDRWKWSRTKVRAFLELLRSEKMVTTATDKTTGCTTILLCNYDRFNTTKEPPGDRRETKGEEGKEGKKTVPLASLPEPGAAAAGSEHQEFIEQWMGYYQTRVGTKYAFTARDAKAAKHLRGHFGSWPEFHTFVTSVHARSGEGYPLSNSATLYELSNNLSQLQAALALPPKKVNGGPKPATPNPHLQNIRYK